MAVFKITDQAGRAILGGASRQEGIEKLKGLDKGAALAALSGLKANLRGDDGVPKHGILKLRNSKDPDKGMEFARMRGLDRMMSSKDTFKNTERALKALMVGAGLPDADAQNLLDTYRSGGRHFKYKDAVKLISETIQIVTREKPQVSLGKTMSEAFYKAGIKNLPQEATNAKVSLGNGKDAGQFGRVFEGTIDGKSVMFKRLQQGVPIELGEGGELQRGKDMDSNHLAQGKVPCVIAPRSYLVSKTVPGTNEKTYHVVAAGKGFKEFCRQADKLYDWKTEGYVMDKATGTRMREARCTPEELKTAAKSFASILMNASSHGMIFGDIKPENAFVDDGKVTLIDTDGVVKRSKWASKNPENFPLTLTFQFPAETGKRGLQQDLWSVGFTLLEASHPQKSNELFKIGANETSKPRAQVLNAIDLLDGSSRPAAPTAGRPDKRQIVANVKSIIGEPAPGSADHFALLCIETALSDIKKNYTKRFTGEGQHLLDPILAHPLLGSRDVFVRDNLVKRDPLSSQQPQGATGQEPKGQAQVSNDRLVGLAENDASAQLEIERAYWKSKENA